MTGCSTLLETALSHAELQHVTHKPEHVSAPVIHVVPRGQPRHVLAIQSTDSMMENIKWLNKAAQALIRYDLDDASEVAVVTFNNVTKVEHDTIALDDESIREKVADTIPGKYQLVAHNATCIQCMLEYVTTQVLHNDTDEAHIVVIVTAGEDLNVEEALKIVDTAQVSFIVLPIGEKVTHVTDVYDYDDVAQLSLGDTFLVSRTEHDMELYYDILEHLHVAMQTHGTTVHKKPHSGHEQMSQGTFYTWTEDVMFRIYVPDTEDHMIKSVTFENMETGDVFGPYTKMSASYDLINIKTPNIVGDLPWTTGSNSKKHWNYTVTWFSGNRDVRSIIEITHGDVNHHGQVSLDTWVQGIDSWNCPDDFEHIKISAVMTPSLNHVTGVEVFASVQILTDNGTILDLPDLKMTQDEFDEDLVTVLLLSYPQPGRYSIKVRAEDLITGETHADNQEHIVRVNKVPTRDCVPPGHVNDLSIAIFNNSDVISATWTSSAGDLNIRDTVDTWRLVVSDDACQLLDNVQKAEIILNIQTRAALGEAVEQMLQWTRYDKLYYVAVVGVDAAGNVGKVSNVVSVHVEMPESAEEPEPVSLSQSESILDNYQSIIIISSSLGGVLMICLLCIVYIIISGRSKQSKASMRNLTPDFTIEQNLSEGVTDVQQILARERQSNGHTHSNGHTTAQLPVYWSCDQILSQTQPGINKNPQMEGEKGGHGHHNYYNCQSGDLSPHSRYSCSSDSYSSNVTDSQADSESYRCHSRETESYRGHSRDTESYRGHSSPYHSSVTQSQSGTAVTDVTDEGYDSASRELELINSRKLYTIV